MTSQVGCKICNIPAAATCIRILSKEGKRVNIFRPFFLVIYQWGSQLVPVMVTGFFCLAVHKEITWKVISAWAKEIIHVPSSDKSLSITNPLFRIQSILLPRVLLCEEYLVGLNSLQVSSLIAVLLCREMWICYSFLRGLRLLMQRGGPEECFLTRHQPDLSCVTLQLSDSNFTSMSKINLSFVLMKKLHGGCFI